MISTSPLLGHLAKSGTKTNTPEEGDTRLQVPGVLSPTISVPYPQFSFFSAPQGSLQPVNSFIYSEQLTFAVTNIVNLIALGPGVWEILVDIVLQEAGAISDATSTYTLNFFALDGTGATVALLRITNKQLLDQSDTMKWRQLVTSDQSYQFSRTTAAGLGTGLNLANLKIIATRLF